MPSKRYKFTGVVSSSGWVVAEPDKKGSARRCITIMTMERLGVSRHCSKGVRLTFEVIFEYGKPTFGIPVNGIVDDITGRYILIKSIKELILLEVG